MKRGLSLLLILVLALVFIGCGEEKKDPINPDPTPEVTTVDVTSIELSGVKSEINVGEDFTITVKVLPSDATNPKVKYSSSNSSVATIKNGVVTGISQGEVTISVASESNPSIKKEFNLKVVEVAVEPDPTLEKEIESITLSGPSEVEEGKSIIIDIDITPADATSEVVWTSSNEGIATVRNGVVNGISQGEAVIKAKSKTNDNIYDEVTIKVIEKQEAEKPIAPTSITITGADEVETGYYIRLNVDLQPAGCSPLVRWESTKPEVATVSEDGKVTGISEGTTYIICYSLIDETVKSSRFKVKVTIDQSSLFPIPDLQGYEILIMNADSALTDLDPFLEGYTKSDKTYKQQAWKETETTFNCKIKVVAYPTDAPYGPTRNNWINQQAEIGQAKADVYIVNPSYLPNYYASGAMHAVNEYYLKFGKNQLEPAAKQLGSYKGNLYIIATGLSQTTIYPYSGLFINMGLLEKYNIQNPAELFNEGNWNFDDFYNWAVSTQALLPDGYYALTGNIWMFWQGLSNASGVKLADISEMKLNFTHKYVCDAVETMRKIYVSGAYSDSSSDVSPDFSGGKAVIQVADYRYVKLSNRFTVDMWGEDTRYGYVPFPYHPSVGKENTVVTYILESYLMFAGARDYAHPAGVTYEDIYRALENMYLQTIKLQESDPSFDGEAVRRQTASSKLDDSASVDALLYFTANKILYDPIFNGLETDSSSKITTAVRNAITKGADYIAEATTAASTIEVTMATIYG